MALTTRIPNARGLCLLSLILGAASLANATNITYYFNLTIGSATATGDVITDGTIGTLGVSNIKDWDITLSDPTSVTLTGPLSGSNSTFSNNGFSLSATATQMKFAFSPLGTDYAFFESNGAPVSFLCFTDNGSTCSSGAFSPGQEAIQVLGTNFATSPSGTQVVAAIPEPGCALLLTVGLAGLWLRRHTIRRPHPRDSWRSGCL